MLGASLAFSVPKTAEGSGRTVLVTSAVASEGKSTTAANLALAQTESGHRVLLIDCDLTRPSLHKLFDLGQSPGLAQVLRNQVAVEDAIRPTELGLGVLPAGRVERGSALTFRHAQFTALLRRLHESYDLVIMDAPPVLMMANAIVMATAADAVLLVIRAGQTDRAAVQDAVSQLRLVGARLVGPVLNDPDGELPRYSGNYYGSYAAHG